MSRQADASSGETIALSTDAVLRGGIANLGARERATAEELSRLDPQLAGLYQLGHELAARAGDPGVAYLLAHVGRELGRGVVRALVGEDLQVSGDPIDDVPENEQNRVTIAAALHLPPMHGLVTAWFHVNSAFSRAAHYRSPGPSGDEVRSAFLRLSELLFGRVAPYFATHAELDRFLAVECPTAADIDDVRALLVRPQQRHYFFTHLQHPAWLVPLEEAGHFESPPDRIVEPDGRWRMQGWPEGEYLARIASMQPGRATEILLNIPPSIENPAVWAIVIDAAKAMPAPHAARLVTLLEQAFRTAPPVLFPHRAIDLVKMLAEQGEVSAFRLAECLLWLRSSRDEGQAQQAETRPLRGRHGTEWMLERLDVYELGEFCIKAIPALEALDPVRTIELFAKRLDRAISLGQYTEGEDFPSAHDHMWWCQHLDRQERPDDVRAIFAVALTGVAQRSAQRDAGSAEAVLNVLRRYATHGLFARIRYAVLASAGSLLHQALDAVVASGELVAPPFGAREAAVLLRAQFENASPDARHLFRYALERGPGVEDVKSRIEARHSYERYRPHQAANVDEPVSETEIAEAVAAWQRERLAWFHDRIPPELQPLAERLGVTPRIPSAEEQALAEVGFYDEGVTSSPGPQSPSTIEELAVMGVEDIVRFLSAWRPDGDSFDGPSYHGLEAVLTTLATEHPSIATGVLALSLPASVAAGYLTALLSGIGKAAAAKKNVPWDDVLPIALAAVRESEIGESTAANEQRNEAARPGRNDVSRWRLLARAAADVVREGCANNAIPHVVAGDVWTYADAAVHSPVTWADTWSGTEKPSLSRAMMAALNTVGGDVVRMLLDVALWNYRHRSDARTSGAEPMFVPEVAGRLAPLLDHILGQQGAAAQGAHAMLGHFVAQLYLLAPEWVSTNERQLFEHGADNPAQYPIWGAYVTRTRLYDSTFRRLRRWYLEAAEVARCCEEAAANGGHEKHASSLAEGLAVHVIVGVMRDLCRVGDEDALVEKTFSGVPVKDRSHAYWAVFKSFSDAGEPVPSEIPQRILAFWEWRVSELEHAQDAPARTEEADGLTWLLITPHLPAADAIRLGLRTLRLTTSEQHTRHSAWGRLGELAEFDAAGTFDLVELLIEQELVANHAFLPHEEVAPPLRAALRCNDPSVRARAERLVHRLGECGHIEFGSLLRLDVQ